MWGNFLYTYFIFFIYFLFSNLFFLHFGNLRADPSLVRVSVSACVLLCMCFLEYHTFIFGILCMCLYVWKPDGQVVEGMSGVDLAGVAV